MRNTHLAPDRVFVADRAVYLEGAGIMQEWIVAPVESPGNFCKPRPAISTDDGESGWAERRNRIGLREVRALEPGKAVWDATVPGCCARRRESDAVYYGLKYRTRDGRQR